MKPANDIISEALFCQYMVYKLDGAAGEWITALIRTTPADQEVEALSSWAEFIRVLDAKYTNVNIDNRKREDLWECKMRDNESIRSFINRFDRIRLANDVGGAVAVAIFEHAIPKRLYMIMKMQTYRTDSTAEAYRAAEKAWDLFKDEMSFFNGKGKGKGKNGGNGGGGSYYAPPPVEQPLTTSQGGDAMDISAGRVQPGIRCFKCGHYGHIAKFCPRTTGLSSDAANKATQADRFGGRRGGGRGRGKGKGKANAATVSEAAGSTVVNNNSQSSYSLFDAAAFEAEDNSLVFLPVSVGSGKFEALVDTGANRNFISREAVRAAGVPTRKTPKKELRMADGSIQTLDEKAFLTIKCGDWEFCDEFVVAPVHFELILGTPWFQHFGVELDFNEKGVYISAKNGWRLWRRLETQVGRPRPVNRAALGLIEPDTSCVSHHAPPPHSSSRSLYAERQALRTRGCGAASESGLGNSSPSVYAADHKEESTVAAEIMEETVLCDKTLEEAYDEEKDIEESLISKTQLRKAVKRGDSAYMLFVRSLDPDEDAALADNQGHTTRGSLSLELDRHNAEQSVVSCSGDEPYSSRVASLVGNNERPGVGSDSLGRGLTVGSGRSFLNAVTEEELKTVEHPRARELIKKYEDVFNVELPPGPPPERDIEFKVDLVDGAIPKNATPYRLAPVEKEELNRQVGKMLERKLIRVSYSDWGSPCIVVKKFDGGYRFCVDYRALNSQTIKDAYPLPRIDELLDRLKGARVFTPLDALSYFWQVPVRKGDEHKLAFRTTEGQWEPVMMPFGVKNGPSTAQRLSNFLFKDFDFVLVYMDDILIFSKDEEEHAKHLELVLQRLREQKVYLKLSKCKFFLRKVHWLGHLISGDGISVDDRKVDAIIKIEAPENISQVRSFLGLVNYYRRHLPNLAQIALPLTELTKQTNAWKWGEKEEEAFKKIKAMITTAPVLQVADTTKPFFISCDASEQAIGGVLSQVFKGQEHPVAFVSRKLTETEKNWTIPEKETAAVHYCLKQWRHYLLNGFKHTVRTDNQALSQFLKQKELSRKQMKWQADLSEFDFELEHRRGKDNQVADALSRLPTATPATMIKPASSLLKKFNFKEEDEDFGYVYGRLKKDLPEKDFTLDGDLLYFKDKLCVPKDYELRTRLLDQAHGKEVSHLSSEKTRDLLSQHYYWPRLSTDVEEFCKTCDVCQRTRQPTKKAGLLQPIPYPAKPFTELTMDFFKVKTAISGEDMIYVVVDRFTKMGKFIPVKSTYTADDVAQVFIDNIVRSHGYPEKIISDRDVKFTSRFWRSLFEKSGTKLAFTTAEHPQTDGQSENRIKTLRFMIRSYIEETGQDWKEHLGLFEFSYNSTKNATTGVAPFELLYGTLPRGPLSLLSGASESKTADEFASKRLAIAKKATEAVKKAQEAQKKEFDKHRRDEEFEVGDQVMISTKGFPAYRKEDANFIGPYPIKKKFSALVYELELPTGTKFHPRFNIEKLKRYQASPERFDTRSVPPPPIIKHGEIEYEVEKILAKRLRGKKGKEVEEYKIRWKGYDAKDDTWEPRSNLTNVPDLLLEFETAQKLKGHPAEKL